MSEVKEVAQWEARSMQRVCEAALEEIKALRSRVEFANESVAYYRRISEGQQETIDLLYKQNRAMSESRKDAS